MSAPTVQRYPRPLTVEQIAHLLDVVTQEHLDVTAADDGFGDYSDADADLAERLMRARGFLLTLVRHPRRLTSRECNWLEQLQATYGQVQLV